MFIRKKVYFSLYYHLDFHGLCITEVTVNYSSSEMNDCGWCCLFHEQEYLWYLIRKILLGAVFCILQPLNCPQCLRNGTYQLQTGTALYNWYKLKVLCPFPADSQFISTPILEQSINILICRFMDTESRWLSLYHSKNNSDMKQTETIGPLELVSASDKCQMLLYFLFFLICLRASLWIYYHLVWTIISVQLTVIHVFKRGRFSGISSIGQKIWTYFSASPFSDLTKAILLSHWRQQLLYLYCS